MTVSWCDDSRPTGVIKPVYWIPIFPLPRKLCNQKDTHLKFVNNTPYKDQGPTANQNREAIKIITQHRIK